MPESAVQLPWGPLDWGDNGERAGQWPGLSLHLRRDRDRRVSVSAQVWHQPTPQVISLGDMDRIDLVPAQPDRPVVLRLGAPISLAPSAFLRGWVSLPLWLMIRERDRGVPLAQWPLQPVSDTWVGESPLAGEFGYGLNGDLLETPVNESWLLSVPVELRNKDIVPVVVDRLLLPAPHLSVFESKGEGFCTEHVDFPMDGLRRLPDSVIGNAGPEGAVLRQAPRRPREKRGGLSTWTSLFER